MNCRMRSDVHVWFVCFVLLLLNGVVNTELVSLAVIGASAAFTASFLTFRCRFYECCENDQWMPKNFTGLRLALNERLYGQHLVMDTVSKAIQGHFTNANPKKALVLSMHGRTGSGKNHVCNIVAEHLFTRGMQSRFVHLFVSTLHFPLHDDTSVDQYTSNLQEWIQSNVTQCGRSLFIFDEIDKMHPRVMDAIKPFIDHHQRLGGVDFRLSAFVFLSNTAGNDITEHVRDVILSDKSREDITLLEMETIIMKAAYNEKGGLRFSSLMDHYLIDHFVPFLPLGREHVKLCVRDELHRRGQAAPLNRLTQVADMLQWMPQPLNLFSASGCKRIPQKVELMLQQEMMDEEREEL